MRSRPWITAVVVGLLAVGAGGAAFASAGDDGHAEKTFTLIQHETNFALITHGPQPAAGDTIVIRDDLLRSGEHGQATEKVGFDNIQCTVTFDSHILCHAATELFGRGQLTQQGVIAFPPPSSFDTAVTGGTDNFRGARGEVHRVQLSQTDSRLTFQLL